jgi:hypothetical protein
MGRLVEVLAAGGRVARALREDPLEVALEVRERLAERGENRAKRTHGGGFMPWPPCPYDEDLDWEPALHSLLGVPWPCPHGHEFAALWRDVLTGFESEGVSLGRGAFAGWGDGEPGFVRAAWCVVRHLRPTRVVETGVARGITSRLVLEALEANGEGHLWSIDLPPRKRPDLHTQVGSAVPQALRSRWSYVQGSSRRRLPPLLGELGTIDVFVHDSKHTERNLVFELERARGAVRASGFLLADDVDLNCGFHRYRAAHADDAVLVCPAEPLRPDPGRQNDRGVFAVIAKAPTPSGTGARAPRPTARAGTPPRPSSGRP